MQVLHRVGTDDRDLVFADMEVGDEVATGQEGGEPESVLTAAASQEVMTGLLEQHVVAVGADEDVIVVRTNDVQEVADDVAARITAPGRRGCEVDHDALR